MSINLDQLNSLNRDEASHWFMQICTASNWCDRMEQSRPFISIEHLREAAKSYWDTMQKSDFLEAFQGHPMIGDINSLRKKYASTEALAKNEQSGAIGADDATLNALQAANKEYLDKHGFIFIICATGLSAKTMLHELKNRLNNTSDQEITNAAEQQLKISLLRIDKAVTTI